MNTHTPPTVDLDSDCSATLIELVDEFELVIESAGHTYTLGLSDRDRRRLSLLLWSVTGEDGDR